MVNDLLRHRKTEVVGNARRWKYMHEQSWRPTVVGTTKVCQGQRRLSPELNDGGDDDDDGDDDEVIFSTPLKDSAYFSTISMQVSE